MAHSNDDAGLATLTLAIDIGGSHRKNVYESGARQDAEASHPGGSCRGVD
jgi:hypothetical protein